MKPVVAEFIISIMLSICVATYFVILVDSPIEDWDTLSDIFKGIYKFQTSFKHSSCGIYCYAFFYTHMGKDHAGKGKDRSFLGVWIFLHIYMLMMLV